MSDLKYIFAQPEYIEGIGEIYPIKLKDYDEFSKVSQPLYISKNHFETTEYPLLALIFMGVQYLGINIEQLKENFITLFSLVTHKEVKFISEEKYEGFLVDKSKFISSHNYDKLREVIMKQNLMFEQKVFKNKLVQDWANKVIEAKSKNSTKISMEDIITTVSVYKGISYEQILEYTIYQIYADFYRIRKIKQYDTDTLFATVSSEKMSIVDFAEDINIFKSPYDDLFVSSEKLNKFKQL